MAEGLQDAGVGCLQIAVEFLWCEGGAGGEKKLVGPGGVVDLREQDLAGDRHGGSISPGQQLIALDDCEVVIWLICWLVMAFDG